MREMVLDIPQYSMPSGQAGSFPSFHFGYQKLSTRNSEG